jgi:probable F420-dependent oxidoreductase
MDFGITYFPTHDALGPGPLARMLEERGQESLFFADHTHIPAARETPWPAGGDLPSEYWHSYDLFVALTAAAAATSRLRIGTGVCLVIQRDPIITAAQVASIDHLSGGRLEFGVGAGWNREEMANHGTDPRVRMAIMRERVQAMKQIWTCDEASYHGEHVALERILSYPKPLQRPHPPVLIGGHGPTVLDRVLDYGDGWCPLFHPGVFERIAELRARSQRPIEVDLLLMPADPALIERARELGVRRVVHALPSVGRRPLERALEVWESAIAQVRGA